MIRKILSILVGYILFVVTSILLFKISGQDPHQPSTLNFQLLTALYGALFSFLSGLVVPVIARTKTINLNYILAFIIAGFASFSLIKSEGSHWSQLFAILIFAPASIFGGLFYNRRYNK